MADQPKPPARSTTKSAPKAPAKAHEGERIAKVLSRLRGAGLAAGVMARVRIVSAGTNSLAGELA